MSVAVLLFLSQWSLQVRAAGERASILLRHIEFGRTSLDAMFSRTYFINIFA